MKWLGELKNHRQIVFTKAYCVLEEVEEKRDDIVSWPLDVHSPQTSPAPRRLRPALGHQLLWENQQRRGRNSGGLPGEEVLF